MACRGNRAISIELVVGKMLDETKIVIESLIYREPSGDTEVHKGWYSPVDPSGEEKSFEVAIKSLTIPGDQKTFLAGLVQEITIAMKLEDCPNVCKCFGYYSKADKVHIVMEYFPKDLDKDIKLRSSTNQKFTETELFTLLGQVTTALLYAKKKVTGI